MKARYPSGLIPLAGGSVPLGRMAARSLFIIVSVAVLGALLPSAGMAAPDDRAAPAGKPREYIITLDVADSGRVIQPSSQGARQRISRRSDRADDATDLIVQEHGIKARQRFDSTVTGFSARMTPAEVAEVAADPKVLDVRPARKIRLSVEVVPDGIERVKAWTTGTKPGPDIDIDVAVIDTGMGPANSNGTPLAMANVAPQGKPELDIRGGYNCTDLSHPDRWGDTSDSGHGTHVAGTVGARDNSVGTVGVAPGARLWAVKVFDGSLGSEADIICGLQWAIDTHSNDKPDIDVINMSMEGGRLNLDEDCDQVLADPEGDPIQQSICTATAMGITVVAAAGNNSVNANSSMPGGFDQVISVGAMTDTDGIGWGRGGSSDCYSGERDDTYASYSNYGREVDIVAPGTCVESAWPSVSGAATQRLSGTSMAAPHVTGAVARYLADHPNTSPDKMRKLVRAAGRLDWNIKSDPVWSSANDTDAPNRVLDVKALTGPDLLKTWVYHDGFTASGKDRWRTTRVDVQRGGGYADSVALDVTGLPGAVGTAIFDDADLDSLSGLGSRLRLDLKTSGPDGIYELGIKANGAGVPAHSRGLRMKVDRTGPSIKDLAPRVRAAGTSMPAKGAVQASLTWSASDELSGVKSLRLQRRTGSQPWRDAGTSSTSRSRIALKPGQNNRFRIKATDDLGNGSTSKTVSARLTVRDSKSSRWRKSAGEWKNKSAKQAYRGSLLVANGTTDSLSTSFSGKAVALVAPLGPGRGSLRVRIDAGDWQTVDLKAGQTAHRKVVWGHELGGGTHTLEIQGKSGQTALDALLIIR